MPVVVEGYQDLMRALRHADRDVRMGVRTELRQAAEPVRQTAETLAAGRIRRIGGPWSRMRVGVTTRVVYVAPRQRGVKGRGYDKRRRPRFGTLLMERAMEPALRQHEDGVVRELDGMLDRVADRFN